MAIQIDRFSERIHAGIAGALAGEAAAGQPSGADEMLSAAESLAGLGEYSAADLRRRGLGALPPCGPGAILVRVMPYGMFDPGDRPRLRRNAYRAALLAPIDEGTAATAVATALLVADLLRFDLDTAAMRVRQTLLEEAPWPVLQRLAPLHPDVAAAHPGDDPGASLQIAITALSTATGIRAAVDAVLAMAPGAAIATSLAGALAGCRDGLDGTDGEWLQGLPAAAPARDAAERLAELAIPRLAVGRVPTIAAGTG
jgi:hypothetical protein